VPSTTTSHYTNQIPYDAQKYNNGGGYPTWNSTYKNNPSTAAASYMNRGGMAGLKSSAGGGYQ
jgi:hypothetical protein